MEHTLVIVSRDKPALFHYLRESYKTREARVILDRRAKERGHQGGAGGSAGEDRRRQADTDADLAFRREVAPPPASRLAPFSVDQFLRRGSLARDAGGWVSPVNAP